MQGEPPTSLPLPPCRFEHVRVLEVRLAAQAADLQRELGSKVAQVQGDVVRSGALGGWAAWDGRGVMCTGFTPPEVSCGSINCRSPHAHPAARPPPTCTAGA